MNWIAKLGTRNIAITLIALIILGAAVSKNLNSEEKFVAGEPCQTLEEIRDQSDIKYICLPNEKGLIWVNQASTAKYALGPAGRLVYRYIDSKQQRLSQVRGWLAKDYRDQKDFDPIRVAAYNSINSLYKDQSYKNIYFEEIIREGFPTEVSESIKDQVKDAAAFISPVLDKKIQIKLILVTERDLDFINNKLPSIVPNNDWQGALDNVSSYKTKEEFYSSSGTGGGTASFIPSQNFGYYIGHTSSLATMETYWPEVAPHEMAHVLQGYLAKGFNSNFPDGHPQAKWARHLIEGSANTLGMAMGFKYLGWYSDEMDLLLQRSIGYNYQQGRSNFAQKFPMKTDQDAYNLIVALEEARSQELFDFSYSAGQFIWEYFVGTYGVEKYFELLKNVPVTDNLNENFKKSIGVSKDEFYKKAAPYLLANWKRLSAASSN
jgi:hypothetical protein